MRGRLHSIVWTACEEAVCAMLTVGKSVSLVQQKKQQWAQERAEMSNLYLPWGSGERYKNRLNVRNQFASSLELHQTYEYQEPLRRHRSPSLPPIYNIDHGRAVLENTQRKDSYNRNVSSVQRFSFYDEDAEGDTSGYGSETVNHKNCRKFYSNPNQSDVVVAWQEEKDGRKRSTAEGALSARSGEEGRPRWGDRGVATGRLWEPTAPNERLPQMQNHKKGTPSWVERGLNNIMDNTSDVVFDPRGSNSGLDCDRSSYNGSDEGRTFLRGQNVPIEPEVKAQRENKRIKALELQSAILGQLEEQEKRREEERLRKLKEERLEELRIQRQQEEDRIRLEEEKRKTLEKQSLEQRKLDTLKKALEEAERRAKQEKEKRFNCLRRNADTNLSNENILATNDNDNETRLSSPSKTLSPTKSNRTYNVPTTATSHNKENNSHQTSAFNSPRSIAPSSLNLYIHNIQPLALADKQINILPIGITGNGEIVNTQNPNNIQLAVLLPQNIKQPECCSVSLNSYDINENNGTERILTPRKYRSGRLKDASTQTDESSTCNKLQNEETEKMYRDYATIDENAPDDHRNTLKRDRRRSEERYKKEIENRPKWGANKPIAQYKKQSEKDPFYVQKRKMRQKYRPQPRQYSQSSDDSRSPSPPLEHDKFQHHNKPRNSISQFFWRTKRHSQDVTPLNPNEPLSNSLDINALSQNEKKSPKISLSKRLTLSQKFINDKYGSRKLWSDDNDKKYLSDIDKKIERNVTNKKDNSNSEIISDQSKYYKTKL
ncbi:PH domain-containing protein DDB_G0287875-like [Aricia agestis]|uniref:PH domain-containing protein DDB_G0287875-like n=1 Tax=Aricia agestis TaxID=91739 RepID=UPI001C20599F|nr:PH domain-containing protein DDB_G0287875-like [Aricia agestis]